MSRAKSVSNVKYGRQWPAGWGDLQIEMACLYLRRSVDEGGLGHQGHLRNVMTGLWPHLYAGEIEKGFPRWNEYVELQAWAWCNYNTISAFGHASAAKSHTFAHIATAEWLCSAHNTAVIMTSTHVDGLKRRIFQYVFDAVRKNAAGLDLAVRRFPTPMVYRQGVEDEKNVIQGVATNKGDDSVARIQGVHTDRVIIVIDEAAGTPKAIFDAAANLRTGTSFFRLVSLMNPEDLNSVAANWAEPPAGFKSIDIDVDKWWETRKRGGVAIHFSWRRSPNYLAGRTVYKYLINEDDVQDMIEKYGEESPQFYTFALGWFPPDGMTGYVFSQTVVEKAASDYDYRLPPVRLAAVDPAFEGGDQAAMAVCEYDPSSGHVKLVEMIDIKGSVAAGITLDQATAANVVNVCRAYDISADGVIVDTTGGGRGVWNYLQSLLGPDVQSCMFGGSPSDRRMRPDDPVTCKERFVNFVSEMWWAAREFCESGLVHGFDSRRLKRLSEDLTSRRYEMKAGDRKIQVETKRSMKQRLGRSPDQGDAFVLLFELLRRKGIIPHANQAAIGPTAQLKRARDYDAINQESWQN
jgi:hypothetical protein